MKPIEITLNLSKIDKSRITERTYEDKNGVPVTVKEYKMTLVPVKDKKFVTKKDNWQLFKTHFLAEKRGKDEEKNYIGDGFMFETIGDNATNIPVQTIEEVENSIPF